MKRLHNIVSHNMEDEIGSKMKDKENFHNNMEDLEESVVQNLEEVCKQADVSPKSKATGGKKGKKQIEGKRQIVADIQQPTRVVPKGTAASDDCIYERLDRIGVNPQLQQWFGHIEVEHLSRTGSDHAPLLVLLGEEAQNFIKPFRFLNFWTEHKDFLDTVKLHWPEETEGNSFLVFKQKIKQVRALSSWSKQAFWDIFKQLIIREDIVRIKEQFFEEEPSAENRTVLQLAQAEMKKRKRLQVNRIQDAEEDWIEEKDQLAAKAVSFFHKQFTQKEEISDFGMLRHIPGMGESACGPDGLSGAFFQSCWKIVSLDVFKVVKAFYEGHTIPKSITQTNLAPIPKKSVIHTFADLRPISLSNFINKVISRVVNGRLDKILPELISSNHSGFVKKRSIIENVLLTQEIVTPIRKKGKPANVVIKLDMAKAYDRVSLLYLTKTRGVKQGDPLSPALFILSAEVLSRALNSLFDNGQYRCFGMPKWSANLSHLACADDTIIFASADKLSLEMTMEVLRDYEKEVEQITGFTRGMFLFQYLGCPIFHTRKRKLKKGGSQLWKKMLEARDAIEKEIWWEPRNRTSNFWFDKWTNLGPLTQIMPTNFPMDNSIQEVADVMVNEKWSYQIWQQTVLEDIVDHIRNELHIDTLSEEKDKD
ncbi:uncharacterized protein LOC132631080 [Lycium barbarum]|uniref:uncharacterized protein LOC132631080 n=1 Tax=Lycium barbarum TaxID=112863 RepID=UPI00293F077C|nr:uncharacterized protein LOC132631080 [Lycium barbarum]